MSFYTKILSWLGSKEANKISMECTLKEKKYKETISKLLDEKTYLLGIIAQNVEDIADIKTQLREVNSKLSQITKAYKKTERKLIILESVENDLTLIIEAFLDKYPDAKLSEMVQRKNDHENS